MRMLLALFTAAMFTTAVADDQTSKHEDKSMTSADAKFDSLDRNNDEQLSRTEAQEEDGLSAQFASVDQDSDGFVSKSEYTAQADTDVSRSENEPY